MLRVRGNFGGLAKWIATFAALASSGLPESVHRQAAEAILTEVKLGFREGRDPYGKRWPKPKHRDGAPLRDRGLLANSWEQFTTSSGFEIFTDVEYAGYLHNGTRHIERRRMVPDGDLPRSYDSAIAEAVEAGWEELWGA